jgi:hypothetical protein
MAFFPESGLGVVFMINLAPMVPEWLSDNPEPKTKINYRHGGAIRH